MGQVKRLIAVLSFLGLCACGQEDAGSPAGLPPYGDAGVGDGRSAADGRDASSDGRGGPDVSVSDGSPGSVRFDPCVPEPQAGYDPASRGLAACCDAGPAHCVPSTEVSPRLAVQLSACPGNNSVCMPDPIIRGGGQYRPAESRTFWSRARVGT